LLVPVKKRQRMLSPQESERHQNLAATIENAIFSEITQEVMDDRKDLLL